MEIPLAWNSNHPCYDYVTKNYNNKNLFDFVADVYYSSFGSSDIGFQSLYREKTTHKFFLIEFYYSLHKNSRFFCYIWEYPTQNDVHEKFTFIGKQLACHT